MSKNWKDEIMQAPCFTRSVSSYEDALQREEEQKQYIANAIEHGEFSAEEGLCYFLQEMEKHFTLKSFKLFKNYAKEINPKKVYEVLKPDDFVVAYVALDFAEFFGDQLSKDTVDPNEVFLDCLYGDRFNSLSEFFGRDFPLTTLSACKDFDANAAAVKLYEELKAEGEEEKIFFETMDDLLESGVTDFTFLAPALKKAVMDGEEFILERYGTLVKKGAIPVDEARELVEKLKKEKPQMYEDLISDGYADFNF